MPLCLSHFFSSFKRKEKKNSQGRSKAPAIFRRAPKRQRIRKRRDSANTNVRASFSFCNVNAPANFGPQSIPLHEYEVYVIRHGSFFYSLKNSNALEVHYTIRLHLSKLQTNVGLLRDTRYFNEEINCANERLFAAERYEIF